MLMAGKRQYIMTENDRKIGLFLITVFLCALVLFALAIVYIAGMPEKFFWIGSALGIGFGLVALAYIFTAWDPVHLRPRNGSSDKALSWAGLAIIGGVIISRVATMIFGEEIQALIFGCTITWVVWTLGSMTILAWWYRPK
jgi:hypothetical protein